MKKTGFACLMIDAMKITFSQLILFAVFTFCTYANESIAQDLLDRKISIIADQVPLKTILKNIESQTKVRFSYSSDAIDAKRKMSFKMVDQKLSDFFEQVLSPVHIRYNIIDDKQILLYQQANDRIAVEGAQERISVGPRYPVTGIVYNEKNEPLAGVNIQEKGSTLGATTNEKGQFSISVEGEGSILVFSMVGFQTQEVIVSGATLTIILKATTQSLEDVVVVGYGVQKKITNTGAQASMAGKLLVQSPQANISNSLVGRLPGLFASQASGEPGNDQSTLRIRGVGTFNGNQEPLVLVDGIQVDNYNNIDPNEIENITILKDASSTAVYGVRGANGVLIITTKRGKVGPAKVSYTFNYANNAFTAIRSQMNSYDYARSFNEAKKGDAYISGSAYVPQFTDVEVEKFRTGSDPIFYPSTDWYKVMLKESSSQQQHNVNINGGTDKVRYAVSAGYFNQEGLFNNTKLAAGYDAQIRFKRYNFRSNLNFNITQRFKAAIDISSQTEVRSGNALNTQNVIENIARANPTVSPGIVDGKLINLPQGGNPLNSLYQSGFQREYRNFLNGSVRLDHDLDFITRGLTVHGIVAYQNFNSQQFLNRKGSSTIITYRPVRQTDGTIVFLPQNEDAQYTFAEIINKNRRQTAELGFNYRRTFGDHSVTGLLLYNQQKTINPTFTFLVPSGYQSYVGRITYDYQGRYLAEVNIAYQGTENFAPDKRFGTFAAYSLGWVASEEKFFPQNEVFTFLKFRGSYGEVGNDQIGTNFLTSDNRFLFRPTAWLFTGGSRFGEVATAYNLLGGVREGRLSNPNLTWERAKKANLGVEMSFWKKNISLSVDVFHERRDNILTPRRTVPILFGNAIPPENLGKMENRGFELDLTLNNNIGAFSYQVKANYSFARNRILFQDEVIPRYEYQLRTGRRNGQYFGLIAEGLYNSWDEVNDVRRPRYEGQNDKVQPGDIRFKDVNGDGVINSFDEVPIGFSQVPEKTYGISFVGQYKGFSLSILFQGVDNVSLNYTRRFTQAFFDDPTAGAVDYLLDSWTQERYNAGLPIKFPRFSRGSNGGAPNNYVSSTYFLADASYLRIKNVEIGYTFNGRLIKKIGLSSTRIFANGNNLYTWSKVYPGVDPESPPTPANLEPYPLVRTINMGFNINF